MDSLPAQYFRAGAGVVLVNHAGLVLALERSDLPGAWQFIQGGLEVGEEPFAAAIRETFEEVGVPKSELERLAEVPFPLTYELPEEARSRKTGRGQAQYWFLVRHTGKDESIRLPNDGEFRSWSWEFFSSVLEGVVEFRLHVYEQLHRHFSSFLAEK